MRILIVKLGSIGDIVHTLPALAAMREALPDSEITWAVERGAAEILRDNPFYIRDEVLYAPDPNVTAAKLDEFSKKGNLLAYINSLVVAVGIGFLLVLWLDLITTLLRGAFN